MIVVVATSGASSPVWLARPPLVSSHFHTNFIFRSTNPPPHAHPLSTSTNLPEHTVNEWHSCSTTAALPVTMHNEYAHDSLRLLQTLCHYSHTVT